MPEEVIKKDLEYIKKTLDELRADVKANYVTRMEFEARLGPQTKIIYGFVGLILTAFTGAVIALVMRI